MKKKFSSRFLVISEKFYVVNLVVNRFHVEFIHVNEHAIRAHVKQSNRNVHNDATLNDANVVIHAMLHVMVMNHVQ